MVTNGPWKERIIVQIGCACHPPHSFSLANIASLLLALFNIYLEEAIREAQDVRLNGIKITGEEINMLCFTNNIAKSRKGLNEVLQWYNMNIN
jgi:hypothetical protein